LQELSIKYKEEQKKRKKLNNELEDMRGKIRVYARIRPMSKTEKENADRNARCYKILDEMSLTIDPESKMA
jgi:head-tail adaptor